MLFFLSKGFFYSANCKREVATTLANGNPAMLLHETDPNRGGTSMEQMLADCPDDCREEIFVPRRPVIPWLHAKEFKIVSLKMIVASMLLHQSKMERKLQAMDEDIHAVPAESDEARVRQTGKRAFASASRHLASDSGRSHSSAGAGAGVGVACEPNTMSVHTESCEDTPAPGESESSVVYAAQKWLTSAEGAAASDPSCSPSIQPAAPAASHAEDSEGAAASAERVQEDGLDSAFRDWWCEPPNSVGGSVGGSVAAAACSGAALSDSSRWNLARTTLRATRSISTMPVHRGSTGKASDLHTLGADLYVVGEVTRQQLSFPPFVLITSTENPGILGLRKVARPRKSSL